MKVATKNTLLTLIGFIPFIGIPIIIRLSRTEAFKGINDMLATTFMEELRKKSNEEIIALGHKFKLTYIAGNNEFTYFISNEKGSPVIVKTINGCITDENVRVNILDSIRKNFDYHCIAATVKMLETDEQTA